MNDGLLTPFRHRLWATRELLAFCRDRDLTEGQLDRATVEGTYGPIRATFRHVVDSDAYYLDLLSGPTPPWYREGEKGPTPSMEELERRAADVAERWEGFLSDTPIDLDRRVGREDFEADAGIVVAQALDHGSEHRSQVATILTQLGHPPPELDGWSYGKAHGRYRNL